jgi:hypothetical protein
MGSIIIFRKAWVIKLVKPRISKLTWTEDIIGAWSVVMSITIDVLEFFRLFLLLTAGRGRDPSEFVNSAKNH